MAAHTLQHAEAPTTHLKGETTRAYESAVASSEESERRRLRYERLLANAPKPKPKPASGQIAPCAAGVKLSGRPSITWHGVQKRKTTTMSAAKHAQPLLQAASVFRGRDPFGLN